MEPNPQITLRHSILDQPSTYQMVVETMGAAPAGTVSIKEITAKLGMTPRMAQTLRSKLRVGLHPVNEALAAIGVTYSATSATLIKCQGQSSWNLTPISHFPREPCEPQRLPVALRSQA